MDYSISTEVFTLITGLSTPGPATYFHSGMNGTNFSQTNDSGPQARRPISARTAQLSVEDLITIPLYALIFILSVLGNLLVIITLVQNKRMRTVTNVFLLNLSVSDLLLAVFCMPFTIIPIMMQTFVFGPVICVMIRYLQGVSVSVSCFTLVAISLERYFAICRPLHSRKWQTLSHSYKTIAVCWLLGFILCIPMAIFTRYWETPKGNAMCRERWSDPGLYKAYTIVLDLILLIIPIIIMMASYGNICYTLWSGMKMDKQEMESQNGHSHIFKGDSSRAVSYKDGFGRSIGPSEMEELKSERKVSAKLRFDTRGVRQSNNEKSKAAKKRVIKMLFAVVLEFFICWTPVFVLQTWMTVDLGHARQNLPQLLLVISFLLSYVSACCNPITYCFMNKNFRNGFRAVFRCCRCNKKRGRERNEMPSYYHYSSARTGISQISSYDKVRDDSDEL